MSKGKKKNSNPRIRWTKSQVQKLKEAVDAYNKNVRRVSRLKGYKELTPQTEKFKQLKTEIGTAQELKRTIKWLTKFAEIKGRPKIYTNPHGVTMLEWRRKRMTANIISENKRRKARQEQLKEQAVYDYNGNVIPNAKKEQLLSENRLINARPETLRTVKTFVDLEKNIRRMAYLANPEVQLQRLRDNIISGIEYVLGKDKGAQYIDKLNGFTIEELEEMYLRSENILGEYFKYRADTIAYRLNDAQPYETEFEQNLNEMLNL